MALRKTDTGNDQRIEAIRAEMFKEPYSICLERPDLLSRYWRSGSERGKHHYLRRAEALAYIYRNRQPRIYRNELLVGNISSKRIAANYYPEGGSIHILEDLFCLDSRPVLPLYLERSEKRKLLALALRNFPRSVATHAFTKPGWFGYFLDFFRAKRYYITEEAGISHLVPDHEGVIKDGLRRSREMAISKLEAGNLNSDSEAFYKGVCIVIDGIRQMAANLAAEAERQAAATQVNHERRLEQGKDVTWGGALYDFTSIQGVGLADAGESLYVLKKLIFENKEFTLEEFAAIVKNNFKGQEQLQARLQNRLPRFGNDSPEVDAAVQTAADIFTEAITKQHNSRGGKYITGFYSMTCHHGFGSVTGALPNGRKAGFRLSNGLSPADGADRKGPTALLNSAAQLDNSKWANCYALNLKFEKSMISGPKGRESLKDLIRGYFRQGGMELQINVQETNILRLAKENPAAYPGLMVRVSGYCSYFCDLSPEVQDEIIERTAFSN